MKYLILSFDDGTSDFKDNSYPILKKYGFLASLNIISGFCDNTIETEFSFLSIEDLKHFHKLGFEIANHTNSHLKHGSYNELKTCNDKLSSWCSLNNIGIVMPKYSKPNRSARRYIKENHPAYVTYDDKKIGLFNNLLKVIKLKIISIFKRNQESSLNYLLAHCMYKKKTTKKFLRLSIKAETSPTALHNALKNLPDNYCLTLCFHSISDKPESCFYPEGTWSTTNFDKFCHLLSNDIEISIVTQKEVVKDE